MCWLLPCTQQQQQQHPTGSMSVQLKSLLGLSLAASSQGQGQGATGQGTGAQVWAGAAAAPVATKPVPSMKEILEEQQRIARENPPPPPSTDPTSPPTPWTGAAAASSSAKAKPGVSPSLKDIMQQEAQQQQLAASQGVRATAPASSWVAKAAKGSSSPGAWVNPALVPTPSAAPAAATGVQKSAPAAKAQAVNETEMFWNFQDKEGREGVAVAASSGAPVSTAPASGGPFTSTPSPGTSKPKGKSDFGGQNMSVDMAEWCAQQLRKLNNSDDLTLVQFCMSLDSPVEVREYLADYLGSTPQVSE